MITFGKRGCTPRDIAFAFDVNGTDGLPKRACKFHLRYRYNVVDPRKEVERKGGKQDGGEGRTGGKQDRRPHTVQENYPRGKASSVGECGIIRNSATRTKWHRMQRDGRKG